MTKSIETRWFLPGGISGIVTWFEKAGEIFLGNWERSDFYLKTAGQSNFSFKIREGKSEIKLLIESLGVIPFGNGYAGVTEKWVKWSTPLKKELMYPAQIFEEPGSFIEVKKERLLCKFEILSDSSLRKAKKSETSIREGCQVELTRMELNGITTFTFGFESFGTDNKLFNNFKVVADKVLAEMPGISLRIENSYSYPAFLFNSGEHAI